MLPSIGPKRLLLLLLLAGGVSPAYAVDFNSYWEYLQTGGEGVDTRTEFQQRYNLGVGVGQGLTYQPTPAISASANVGYSTALSDQEGDLGSTNDVLTPTGQVSLNNDIFLTQLSGATTGYGSDDMTKSWDWTLASNWVIPFFPALQYNYSEQTETSGSLGGFTSFGTDTKTGTLSASLDLLLAQLSYQHNGSQSLDLNSNTQTESGTHFVRLESGGKFWDRRINVNVAQQFQYATQDVTLGQEGGTLDFPLEEGTTLSRVIDPLSDLTPPEEIPLDPNPELGNGIFDIPAVPAVPGQRLHLGISFRLDQQIDTLRLTLDPAMFPSLSEDQAALQWDLYVRDPLDTGWQLAAAQIPATFDSNRKQFNLTINRRESAIMVVANIPDDLQVVSLNVTELQAFSVLTQNLNSSTVNSLTDFSMRTRLTRTLSSSIAMTREQLDGDTSVSQQDGTGGTTGGQNATSSFESGRLAMSGNLRWAPFSAVSESLGFSQVKEEASSQLDQISRSYSFTLTTLPLPSLNVIGGVTRAERYSGEQITDSGNKYSLTSSARIYPGLNAAWYLTYSKNETLSTESIDSGGLLDSGLLGNGVLDSGVLGSGGVASETGSGTVAGEDRFIDSTTLSSRLNLTAQLFRNVTADITTNYRKNEREFRESLEGADGLLSLQYRPSDILAMRGVYITTLMGDEQPDTLALGLSLGLLRTYKTRLNFDANHSQAETKSDRFGLRGSWDISKNLMAQTNWAYTMADLSFYTIQASLSLKL